MNFRPAGWLSSVVSWLELLRLAARLVVLGVGGIFLGFLDAAGEIRTVDILHRDSRFRQQRAAGRNDVGKTTKHDIAFFAARRGLHRDDTRLDRGHDRRVMRHDSHLAFGARNDD